MIYELLGCGMRLVQDAAGYVVTMVDGVTMYRRDKAIGEAPGRLV
jgi:N-acyl-D-amino-acid deacylase